jgi:hypothetical protein
MKPRPSRFARRLPTVDFPAPIRPTRTIGRSRLSRTFLIDQGYTFPPQVGQKPFVPSIKPEGPMPRAVLFLIIIVVIIAGALVFLSSQAREVPTHSIQVDVTNAAGH